MADHFRLHGAALLVLLAGSSLALTTSRGVNARDGSSVWGITVFLNDVFFPKEDDISFKPVPPPHTEVARMARYILHQSGKYIVCTSGFFFSTFLRKLKCQKNSKFALRAKTQAKFCPKTQIGGSFSQYLKKNCRISISFQKTVHPQNR